MPPSTLVLSAFCAVLGTLAVSSVASNLRVLVAIGLAALCAFSLSRGASPPVRALLLGALVTAAFNASIRERVRVHVTEHRTARYAAAVLERTLEPDGSAALVLLLENGLRVSARVRNAMPSIGARVVVRGRLGPFDDARNPGEPSQRSLERERGIDAQLASAAVLATEGVSQNASTRFQVLLGRAHAWAHAEFRKRLGEPQASVLAGELWGERSALPPDLRAEFQETGTVHVLVTAGLHLGVVAALIVALLSPLALPRWLTCACAVAAIWLFVWWSGAQLPAERAAVMATAALAARACGRATFSWNALALAAIVIAFARPQSIATASFALSFSCVGAIFACALPIERWIEARIALPERVREALVLSIATQIGTWPLGAAVFLQFAPYAVLANLAVVPCVAATMTLGALQLAFAWFAPLAQASANLNSWLLAWMLGAVRCVSALPAAGVPMTPPPAWCVACYDAAIVAAPHLVRRGAHTLAIATLLLAAGFILWPPRAQDPRLRITVLDVGQADAIVVQTPKGHALLVDAGGRLERGPQGDDSAAERVGERIVVPFLLRHGIHALEAIVLSHPHGDHAGGIAPVLRRLRVAELADSGQRYGGHAYQDAIATARADRVPIVYPRAGMQWRTDDGVALTFLGPSLPFVGGRNAINENSIAFTLRYRTFCMLFTGDAGVAAEQRFLREGIDLRCTVLKVGHHGSAYSSSPAFIAAVHPQYAVISVGRHNLFGHPAPTTLATLHAIGARIYRTDENGATTVTTDGERTEAKAELP